MAISDKNISCRDCGSTFVFTVGDQEFFAEKGFSNEQATNRSAALRVGVPAGTRTGGALVDRERCILRFARSVALILWFLSYPVATDRYTAATASAT